MPRVHVQKKSKAGRKLSCITCGDEIQDASQIEEITPILQQVAESVNEIVYEYQEAAENFGGQGENQERADELEYWASDLEQFDAEEPSDEPDDDEIAEEVAEAGIETDDDEYDDAIAQLRSEKEDEIYQEALSNAKSEAEDLLNNCPY